MTAQKVVLVTGCTSGLGRLMAESFAERGLRVFASVQNLKGVNGQAREEMKALAENKRLPLEVVELDVTQEEQIARTVASVIDTAGGIDVLVNNAGVAVVGVNEAHTVEQARWIMETNFLGMFRVDRAVLPCMRRQHSGLLVHISSVLARTPLPFLGMYCASKAAIEVMAETFRYQLCSFGIDSVLVEPGAYPSNMVSSSYPRPGDEERLAEYGQRAARADEMFAGLVAMVSGPAAPDPREVADAVFQLIETPPGRRPLRTLVGSDAQIARQLNLVAEQTERQFLEAVGLADLMSQPEN